MLLFVFGRRVQKDVVWLVQSIINTVTTARPGVAGRGNFSPYPQSHATNRFGAAQETEIVYSGFDANRTTRLVRTLLIKYLPTLRIVEPSGKTTKIVKVSVALEEGKVVVRARGPLNTRTSVRLVPHFYTKLG